MNYEAGSYQTCTPDIKISLQEAHSGQCTVDGTTHSIALHTEEDLLASHMPSETAEVVIKVCPNVYHQLDLVNLIF